jgi:synaptobrevin family protein YKT6
MKLVAIAILRYNRDTPEPVMLAQATELSSFGFFQRQGIKEMTTFFSKTIVKRTQPGQRQTVQHEGEGKGHRSAAGAGAKIFLSVHV